MAHMVFVRKNGNSARFQNGISEKDVFQVAEAAVGGKGNKTGEAFCIKF
ncbi:MAG: hypothetical protein IPH16_12905 [Haliscomenobacter sp.]|nr:hypothetical protein [Haliscomenobacter sp.]MBK7477426.1 hypothetical protein [Haliscomenobacter sp.]